MRALSRLKHVVIMMLKHTEPTLSASRSVLVPNDNSVHNSYDGVNPKRMSSTMAARQQTLCYLKLLNAIKSNDCRPTIKTQLFSLVHQQLPYLYDSHSDSVACCLWGLIALFFRPKADYLEFVASSDSPQHNRYRNARSAFVKRTLREYGPLRPGTVYWPPLTTARPF